MAVTLVRGEPLTRDDLNIYVYEPTTPPTYVNPFRITYTIYRVISDRFYNQECGEEPINETIDSVPLPFGTGKYYAPWVMPRDISVGRYRIKWNIKRYSDSPYFEEAEEFQIIKPAMTRAEACGSNGNGDNGNGGDLPHNTYNGGCAEGV